ncbi:MAG TPA: Holliday junction branch migration protein RuvA [Gemmatimonadaceae bacterium]|nr:Holliday junction branch migration protein RuvA [Gemmatimonadaceae bacterium]
MISLVSGRLHAKDLDSVEILTSGGVGYELAIPLSVYESLPHPGDDVTLYTHLVVREDGWQLFGFGSVFERRVFQRVLDAKGVGPALALGMLSALTASRLVRAIRERDVATLQSVPRVGRKKAEQLILDLADKMDDVQADPDDAGKPAAHPEGASVDEAMRALVSLGYTSTDAERATRKALDDGGRGMTTPELIRRALAVLGGR